MRRIVKFSLISSEYFTRVRLRHQRVLLFIIITRIFLILM